MVKPPCLVESTSSAMVTMVYNLEKCTELTEMYYKLIATDGPDVMTINLVMTG